MENDLLKLYSTCEKNKNDILILNTRNQDMNNKCLELQVIIDNKDNMIHNKDIEILKLQEDVSERDKTINEWKNKLNK
jgi:hypothetical protein